MTLRKCYVGLSAAQERLLEKLAAKLGLDKSSAIRYSISRVAEQEGLTGGGRARSEEPEPRR